MGGKVMTFGINGKMGEKERAAFAKEIYTLNRIVDELIKELSLRGVKQKELNALWKDAFAMVESETEENAVCDNFVLSSDNYVAKKDLTKEEELPILVESKLWDITDLLLELDPTGENWGKSMEK
jgi:hypothetical protein